MKWKIGLAVLFTIVATFCWTGTESIDINSGRVRQRQYFFGVCVHETISETCLSRQVGIDAKRAPAKWHAMIELWSPRSSISGTYCYRYGGAAILLEEVETMWRQLPFTPAAKDQIAEHFLNLLRREDGCQSAMEYMERFEILYSRNEGAKPIDAVDLPSPELNKR